MIIINLKSIFKNKIILIILSLIFIFSISKIIFNLYELNKNKRLYEDIINNTNIDKKNFINVDFDNLLKTNKDTKGFISFNYINYVFVQSKDNNYYLKRSFKLEYSLYGTLFLDYRNNIHKDKNIVIYGHNAQNFSMFGSLKMLLNENYFDNNGNDIIQISTPLYNYNYKIFSIYVIEKENYYITTSFKNKEFKKFIDIIKKRSYYKFNVLVDEKDKILTLSTCNGNNGTSKRTVVHAKLIEKMKR